MGYFFTGISILIFIIYLLITSPLVFISILLSKEKQQKNMYFYWKYFSKFVINVVCLAKVKRVNFNTQKFKQTLYVSNHRSLMDIPLFAGHYQVTPLMKEEILKIPIIGLAAKMTGAITVSRKDNNSRIKAFRACLKALASGTNMLFFPEGTRSQLPSVKKVDEINTPLIQYAFKMNIPVTPITIKGSDQIIKKNGQLNYFTPLTFITHEALIPSNFENDQDFIKACWDRVVLGYNQL